MGFMNEVSEEAGEQYAYKNVLNKLKQLKEKYIEKYSSNIPEMYLEVYIDIIDYLNSKIKD